MELTITPLPAATRPYDVVGFGQNSLDLVAAVDRFPTPDSSQPLRRFAKLPGGEIATAMVACARLGWRARYIGMIGSDYHGCLVEEALEREGVDVSAVRRADAPNRLAVIIVDRQGTRTVLSHRDPRLVMTPADVDTDAVTSGRVLLVDAFNVEASMAAARAARAAGIPTVIDVDRLIPGIDRLLPHIDVLIASESFPMAYTGARSVAAGLRRLADEFRPALAVVTLGESGSLALCHGMEIRTPAFKIEALDTTGAGDAFRGGFLSAWLREGARAQPHTLLEYANAAAALNCESLGAQPGLPTQAAVDALLTGASRERSK